MKRTMTLQPDPEELPAGGFRGDEELPAGGFRG
mgnify:FL=1